jgi:hypothetical protein
MLGDPSKPPRLVIITEGQWDAITLAGAFGWLSETSSIPDGVLVFGLRGASSGRVLLAAWGEFLRIHAPRVWIIGDHDAAGSKLVERGECSKVESEPSFVDRLRAIGCTAKVQFLVDRQRRPVNDFNDFWKLFRPDPGWMAQWADNAGVGELLTTENTETQRRK